MLKEMSNRQKQLKQLKAKKPKDLDNQFAKTHNEVFAHTNCLDCANCCKTTSPMFFERDIEHLAQHFNMKTTQFIDQYLYLDTDGIYALISSPCPFLGDDNYCSVYDNRPKACREYPHTQHRKMHNKLQLAEKNSAICPAVEDILQRITEHYFG